MTETGARRRAEMFAADDPRPPPRFTTATDPDGDFDGAVPDPAIVAAAWDAWRAEVLFADQFTAAAPNLDVTGVDGWRVTPTCSANASTAPEPLVCRALLHSGSFSAPDRGHLSVYC